MSLEKTKIPLPTFTKQGSSLQKDKIARRVLEPLPTNPMKTFSKRKSKSYTDLTALTSYKPLDGIRKGKVTKPTLSVSTVTRPKLRRSMSTSNLLKSTNDKAINTAASAKTNRLDVKRNNTVSKVTRTNSVTATSTINNRPLKRTAENAKGTEEVKAKVAKPARIPAYDYKARFNALTEKHTSLQAVYKETKEKLANLENQKENYLDLLNEHDTLKKQFLEKENENELLKAQNSKLLSDLQSLTKELKANVKEYQKLCSEHRKLSDQYQTICEKYENAATETSELKSKLGDALLEISKLEESIDRYKTDLQNNEGLRRTLHNTIQDLRGRIRVICRVRPILKGEEYLLPCNINFVDESTIEIRKSKESVSISGKPCDLKMEFSYDKVFGPRSGQKEVFEDLAHLVQSALDGYHVCVFAYGQTGSGKTYTMQGGKDEHSKGMIPLAVDLIFKKIEDFKRLDWDYKVQVSFLEIYNETIKDLLNPGSKEPLDIQHNDGRTISVRNLTIENVSSAEQLLSLMQLANKNRAVAATNFNEHSSRSHAVTKIYIEGCNECTNTILSGSLNLVDLAGSESAKMSERMTETKCINKSLSTLGTVMLALHNNDSHVPYRNSKLTHLLQNCLGGNSKTLMVVNISPLEDCYSETINSLRFASKVKEVRVKAKKNKTYSQIDDSSSSTSMLI